MVSQIGSSRVLEVVAMAGLPKAVGGAAAGTVFDGSPVKSCVCVRECVYVSEMRGNGGMLGKMRGKEWNYC